MIEVRKTKVFLRWLAALRDPEARYRIRTRLKRLAAGNPGPHRVLDAGVIELKIDHGSGYRVYYTRIDRKCLLVLLGGDKRTQRWDIEAARSAARHARNDDAARNHLVGRD
jgi:putative addiction module killer protein